jgi:dimethylaniline monooxygenase (N-oxide forming)
MPLIYSNWCQPVPDIAQILGPRKIQLKSGRILEDVDAIIYCTGYHSCIPVNFEPQNLDPFPYPGAPPKLYRNIFPLNPDPAIRNSLAFFGQAAAQFPGFIQYEVQAMAVSQIWQGKASLPSLDEMKGWQDMYMNWRERTITRHGATSTFYPVFVPMGDYFNWLDQTAGLGLRARFGLLQRWTNPKAWSLWWNDRALYNQVLGGLTSPAIARLFDEGRRKTWDGARAQVFRDEEVVNNQQKARQKIMDKEKSV